jgi:hypothetical protein
MDDREFNTIVEEALALDTESRVSLMDTLAASIENEHEFLDEKLEELDIRWKSIENGEARTVSIDKAVSNARRKIAR